MSESVQSINDRVDVIEGELDGFVRESAFTEYINEQDEINRQKADKSDIIALSGAIGDVHDEVEQEKAERISGDSALDEKIEGVYDDIEDLRLSVESLSGEVASYDDKIEQERQDRIAADEALIGTSADTMSDDTIWGAKKYAANQKSVAITEAKNYTDNVFDDMESMLVNEVDSIRTDLSGKADKSYVDGAINEVDEQIRQDLNSKIDAEITRAKNTENNLQYQINELADLAYSADTKEIYKRINVITTYSGDTPEDYVDTGNGILDVLHREFHELEDEIGIVTNPTLERNNEYEIAFGQYNSSSAEPTPSGQTIFSIGIGTSDEDRRNAVEVRKNGDLYLWVEGEFMKVNDLLAMLAHETYN